MKSSNYLNVFRKYFLCFMFYSVLGWCYEVFLDVVVYRDGFIKRGFLFGTYCPVYGFGGMFFLYICQPFLNKLMKNEDSKKLKIIFTTIFSIFVLDFLLKIGFMIF